jgi:hypothetical protein
MAHPGVDWTRYVDAYCERTAPGFWAEPVNALTNVAFLLAAALLARELRGLRVAGNAPVSLWLLVALMVAIGIGSFLVHTYATAWAEMTDVVPIYLFMLTYAASFARWIAGLRWRWAWLGAPAFVLWVLLVRQIVPVGMFGVGGYFPALLALAAFALWCAWHADPLWRGFALTAAIFAVSLTLRQSDQALCAVWPLGTHFGWHLLNAVTLYVATATLLRAARRESAGRSMPAAARVSER